MADIRDETADYVSALRTSTDRARYSLYVVIVATVLVFIANYNISERGWPRKRLDTWFSYARGTPALPAPPPQIARGDAERLKELRTEYTKQFVSRSILTTSPIPGVSIDVNDLGLFGGITLILLMLVFAASIAREHENVYLAMFKVRLVWQENPVEQSKGGSRANLLYHALAMTQVLNAPPTLARWERPRLMGAFRILFISPALVYGWVVWTEWQTTKVSKIYGVDVTLSLWIELIASIVLMILGALTWLHSRAMADRWERAFYVINPARNVAPQMTLWEWLRVGRGKKADPYLTRQRLTSSMVDQLQIQTPRVASVQIKPVSVTCNFDRITRTELEKLRTQVLDEGLRQVREQCSHEVHDTTDLVGFTVAGSILEGRRWTVTGSWSYRCTEGTA